MALLEYYAKLRRELISAVTGVQDASQGLGWDNTTPNYVIRSKLLGLYDDYVYLAREFGLYIVTRHGECGNPKHEANSIEGYSVGNLYGLSISYRDPRYIWKGGQMYQGERTCTCPCTDANKPSRHHIIEDVIYDKNVDENICKELENVLSDIFLSKENSGDNKPRSAIREYLLRAILTINDQIMPVPMDDYIDHYLQISRGVN